MHNAEQAVLAVILILAAAGILRERASRARAAFRPSPAADGPRQPRGHDRAPRSGRGSRSSRRGARRLPGAGILEFRRAVRLEELRHRHRLLLEWARHRMRMEQREADWDRRHPASEAPSSGAPEPGAEDTPVGAPDPGSGRHRPATVPGDVIPDDGEPSPAPPDPWNPDPPPPAEPPPSPPQPEGTPVSNPGPVEQAVDGLHRVHATASAGNIRAKQWAIKVCTEIFTRAAALALMLSRTVAERGYGPEISEPLARAGAMAQAAAACCAEADTAITTLAHMTVGELADSPRQAPQQSELSETGAR